MTTEVMCEDLFKRLATEDPMRLIGLLVDGNLDATDLTFAAEYAGRIRGEYQEEAQRVLEDLACHPVAMVREGAEYGLDALAWPVERVHQWST